MNALTAYFAETGDNIAKLAERIGRAPSTITRPLRGERNVSMNVALEVETATGGRVPAAAFVAICLDAKRAVSAGCAVEPVEPNASPEAA